MSVVTILEVSILSKSFSVSTALERFNFISLFSSLLFSVKHYYLQYYPSLITTVKYDFKMVVLIETFLFQVHLVTRILTGTLVSVTSGILGHSTLIYLALINVPHKFR